MTLIAETPRLILRQWAVADAADLYALNNDPEVLRYTGDDPFESVEAATAFIRAYDHYEQHGMGRWAMELKETGRMIGWCGLKRHPDRSVDLGFRLLREYWGRGLATEAAQASLDYGRTQWPAAKIIGRASRDNGASLRILEKLGFVRVSSAAVEGIADAVLYEYPIV